MYSIKTKEKEKKTLKGILKVVIEKDVTHANYKKCIFEKIQMKHKQTRIIQENHKMYSAEQNKVSLGPFNNKNWFEREEDAYKTHFRIQKQENSKLIYIMTQIETPSERE